MLEQHWYRKGWERELGLQVGVLLQSPLLPMGTVHVNDYRGVKKETFLQVWLWCDEYCAMLDVVFCCYGFVRLGKPKLLLFRG